MDTKIQRRCSQQIILCVIQITFLRPVDPVMSLFNLSQKQGSWVANKFRVRDVKIPQFKFTTDSLIIQQGPIPGTWTLSFPSHPVKAQQHQCQGRWTWEFPPLQDNLRWASLTSPWSHKAQSTCCTSSMLQTTPLWPPMSVRVIGWFIMGWGPIS